MGKTILEKADSKSVRDSLPREILSDNTFQRHAFDPQMYLLVGGASSIAIQLAKWSWADSKTPTNRDPPNNPPHPNTYAFNFRLAIKRHWMKLWSNISCNIRVWILAESSAQWPANVGPTLWGFRGINAETQYLFSSILAIGRPLRWKYFSTLWPSVRALHVWKHN